MCVSARLFAYSTRAFTLAILVSLPLQGQEAKPSTNSKDSTAMMERPTTSSNTSTSGEVNLFYTSQLFGYFREPDLQPRSKLEGCAAWANDPNLKQYPTGGPSLAAKIFRELWDDISDPGKILVGTGDNLAPVLWARQFDPNQSMNDNEAKGKRTAKELFTWDTDKKEWVPNDRLPGRLLDLLKHGKGTIPTDNAVCFLRHAGYAAVVPGKYDFYFGPDRLRELARLLASETEGAYRPVQMLGANLVIETTWKNDHKPVGDTEDPPRFAPWPTAIFAKEPSKQ